MIQRVNLGNKKKYPALLEFIKNCNDSDFYLTENNERIYIQDEKSLNKLSKNSRDAYELEDRGDCRAFCLVWKSCGGDKTRYYIKLLAENKDYASQLLRGFLWNVSLELFVKINKRHPFLEVFKKYGFKFIGGRGRQVLLCRAKVHKENRDFREFNKDAQESIEE